MKRLGKYILIAILLFNTEILCQFSNEHIGIQLGLGSIKGNSPAQSSLAGSLSFGFNHMLLGDIGLRFGYIYARKVNYFLPENSRGKYYPFLQAVSVMATIEQELQHNLFVEEGMGFCAVNDRTFSDINEWAYGVVFSVMAGWDLRDRLNKGLKIGFNAESALTFTSTTASYFILGIKGLYYY